MLDGHAPSELHEHYEDDGTPEGRRTGWTVVTREPEWSSRDAALIQALRFDRVRRHTCGELVQDVLVEPDTDIPEFDVETHRCLACAASAIANRDADMHRLPADDPARRDWEPGLLHPEDGIVRRVRLQPLPAATEEVQQ